MLRVKSECININYSGHEVRYTNTMSKLTLCGPDVLRIPVTMRVNEYST